VPGSFDDAGLSEKMHVHVFTADSSTFGYATYWARVGYLVLAA
jgi:hypothetical protein